MRFDGGRLIVSSLYAWYADDFGPGEAGVIEHLKRYAEAPLLARLGGVTTFDGDEYDWALTDAKGAPMPKVNRP